MGGGGSCSLVCVLSKTAVCMHWVCVCLGVKCNTCHYYFEVYWLIQPWTTLACWSVLIVDTPPRNGTSYLLWHCLVTCWSREEKHKIFLPRTSDSVAVMIGFISEHFSFLEHAWFCIQEPPVPDH